jgi:aconitate hydratase
VSPETAATSALTGVITDPRDLDLAYPRFQESAAPLINTEMLESFLEAREAQQAEIVKGPNIKSLPLFEALPDHLEVPVLLVVPDNILTDEILLAGIHVLHYRSHIPKISTFPFEPIDATYVCRARPTTARHRWLCHSPAG